MFVQPGFVEPSLAEPRFIEPGLGKPGFVERWPGNPIAFPRTLFLEQLRQHGTLLQSCRTTQCFACRVVSLLWNAQFEIELCERKVCRKAAGLKLDRLFQVIEGWIDVAGERVSESDEDMCLS